MFSVTVVWDPKSQDAKRIREILKECRVTIAKEIIAGSSEDRALRRKGQIEYDDRMGNWPPPLVITMRGGKIVRCDPNPTDEDLYDFFNR